MKRNVNRKTHRARAFSILELLLVLVILGILAGIVGVRFAGQSGKAKITATKTEMGSIKTALQTFELHIGRFPTTQEGLDALYEEPSGLNDDEWEGPYLDERIDEDEWGNEYVYTSPGDHNKDYDLYSFGPDGKDGGDDDITNWSEEDE